MNIFYTEVDENLQKELNARGRTGFYDRSTRALNFMVGKIANVELKAYAENDSNSKTVGSLGGEQMRTGRYLPTGADGFLSSSIISHQDITFYTERDAAATPNDPNIIAGNAYVQNRETTDSSRRTGPYITAVDVNIGDHSMGLLNKAIVQFAIPNPSRDLDVIEQIWFRPGRYMSIDVAHADSALVSANGNTMADVLANTTTNGRLTDKSIPNREKLERLYPSWKTEMDKFIRQMSRLNALRFEGLITQFDFQYQPDGSITATLNITGTSNIYTDISMYLETDKAKNEKKPKPAAPSDLDATVVTGSRQEFYEVLFNRVKALEESLYANVPGASKSSEYIIPYSNTQGDNPGNTDRYILVGEPYRPTQIVPPAATGLSLLQVQPTQTTEQPESNFSRYITFGALVHYVNNYIVTKVAGSVNQPEIVFTDEACYSNYYDSLTSCIPNDILLLPEISPSSVNKPVQPNCNTYGDLIYYENVNRNITTTGPGPQNTNTTWLGVYRKVGSAGKYYPSRIFINLETIQSIVDSLSKKNTTSFSVTSFISSICSQVAYATGGAIQLNLVSHPEFQNKLMLMDTKYIDFGRVNDFQTVIPYSVPMFSNHPNGSVVRDFSFSAKLPENAKNLSYVLNNNDDVSELDIAPFMNFMYNAQNVAQINEFMRRYRESYDTRLAQLYDARAKLGQSPGVPELQTALRKTLAEYVKKPFPDFKKTTQMAAPIFPFEATFTVDGINGFKYGDVVQFEALPLRYRMNTVFSIIGVNHTVTNNGEWTTQCRCIMRPSIN
jgi:hypothetical protein